MANSSKEYMASIDRRLSNIENRVCKMQADLAGLRVKVAGISTVVSLLIWGATKWLN